MTNFIEPYKSEWKTEFDKLKRVLQNILEGFETDIQHVGSTAIAGMAAKPILDIDIIINNKALLKDIETRLEKNGYISKGEQGIPGRFAFKQAPGNNCQEHHLYVCYADSLALKNHLVFRDALLNDPKLAEQYSVLKMSLANEKGMTREKYTKLKTEFIISVLSSVGLDENEVKEIKQANA